MTRRQVHDWHTYDKPYFRLKLPSFGDFVSVSDLPMSVDIGPYVSQRAINEPTTAVVRGGKRSLRAHITAREALSNVISRPEVYVCMYVCTSVRDMY